MVIYFSIEETRSWFWEKAAPGKCRQENGIHDTLHTRFVRTIFYERESMMSRQQRRIQLPLVGTILLCLLVGVYLLAWKRFSKPDPSTIIKHSVDTPSDEALKHWTADKMRNAKAANLPNVNALSREKQHPRRPPHTSNPRHSG